MLSYIVCAFNYQGYKVYKMAKLPLFFLVFKGVLDNFAQLVVGADDRVVNNDFSLLLPTIDVCVLTPRAYEYATVQSRSC